MSVHRVNVNFSEEAWRTLRDLAERKNKTISDVIRDAIALEVWFHEATTDGGRVLVERDSGRVREVVRR